MVKTTDAYLAEQKQELREKSYVFVYMGIINQNARDNATVEDGLTDYSNTDSAFRKRSTDLGQYATLEEHFTKVDGSNAYLPRDSEFYSDGQGLITDTLGGTIHITFPTLVDVDIKGLTIDFGEEYPTSFTITNGSVSNTYQKEDDSLFTCEDQFDDCNYLDIIPNSMSGGQQRFRILSMEFGIGLSFSNDEIISTQRRNTVSHISENLPLKTFDFTIDNLSRKFSQDNPFSFANYIQEGQAVEYKYGRDIVDDEELGTSHIEYIDGGKTYIKTWSSTDLSAKFSTVGKLDMMDNEYYKGTYAGYDKTAYAVAEEVLQDAGLTSDEYVIAPYLKTIFIHNPLPIATHKACLQMIANCSRSILYEDRQGRICLKSSFIPEVETYTTRNGYLDSLDAFDIDKPTYPLASLEENYTRVDDTMYFLARDTMTKQPGLISGFGNYGLDVTYSVPWTFSRLTLYFSEILPNELVINYYREEELLGTLTVDSFEPVTVINHLFEDVDKLTFDFTVSDDTDTSLVDEYNVELVDENETNLISQSGAVSRLHILHVIFDYDTGYEITNMDMVNKPTATSIEKIKNINVKYYNYSIQDDMKQLTTVEISQGTNIIKLSNPAYGGFLLFWEQNKPEIWDSKKTYTRGDIVIYGDSSYELDAATSTNQPPGESFGIWIRFSPVAIEIVHSGSYYLEVLCSSVQGKLVIWGRPFDVNYFTVTQQLHDIGNNKNLNNVLIDSELNANRIVDWLSDYYSNDTQYTIQYRGEPALDCDDLIYLENDFVKQNLCRIEEEEISTAIGMSLSNNMKLRRVKYKL